MKLCLPVLHIEVHYGRDKLRCIEKEHKTDDPLNLLWLLMQQSKQRICKLIEKCYPYLPYVSYEDGLAAINAHRKFPQAEKDAMRTLLAEMRRKQTIDKAFQSIEKQQIKTVGLLKRFFKLGISPIPLRKGYAAKRMPSLTEILQTVGNAPFVLDLHFEK